MGTERQAFLAALSTEFGAELDGTGTVPLSFGNDDEAIQAAQTGVAVGDRSHWGRLQLTDRDRLTFLHNQSTNDFQTRQPGQGCETVFVTSTARTLDLATAYVQDDAVIVVVSPQRRESLYKWLDRYIFFGDQVKLTDVTEATALLSLVGPDSAAVLAKLGITELPEVPHHHVTVTLAEQSVQVAQGSGLALPGYTLLMAATAAAPVWHAITAQGAIPLGDRAWEQLRITQGRPAPDTELTDDYNAVEACLWQAISLNKGCYIGQETIARLDTYKGVKQQIWGIRLAAPAEPGTPITVDDSRVGTLTSVTTTAGGPFGLGYVRTKAGGLGLQVQVGDTTGELVEVPFLQRDRG